MLLLLFFLLQNVLKLILIGEFSTTLAHPWNVKPPGYYTNSNDRNGSPANNSSKGRTLPNYFRPMFSRYTPYLTEDSLPAPVYGRPLRRYRGHHPSTNSDSRNSGEESGEKRTSSGRAKYTNSPQQAKSRKSYESREGGNRKNNYESPHPETNEIRNRHRGEHYHSSEIQPPRSREKVSSEGHRGIAKHGSPHKSNSPTFPGTSSSSHEKVGSKTTQQQAYKKISTSSEESKEHSKENANGQMNRSQSVLFKERQPPPKIVDLNDERENLSEEPNAQKQSRESTDSIRSSNNSKHKLRSNGDENPLKSPSSENINKNWTLSQGHLKADKPYNKTSTFISPLDKNVVSFNNTSKTDDYKTASNLARRKSEEDKQSAQIDEPNGEQNLSQFHKHPIKHPENLSEEVDHLNNGTNKENTDSIPSVDVNKFRPDRLFRLRPNIPYRSNKADLLNSSSTPHQATDGGGYANKPDPCAQGHASSPLSTNNTDSAYYTITATSTYPITSARYEKERSDESNYPVNRGKSEELTSHKSSESHKAVTNNSPRPAARISPAEQRRKSVEEQREPRKSSETTSDSAEIQNRRPHSDEQTKSERPHSGEQSTDVRAHRGDTETPYSTVGNSRGIGINTSPISAEDSSSGEARRPTESRLPRPPHFKPAPQNVSPPQIPNPQHIFGNNFPNFAQMFPQFSGFPFPAVNGVVPPRSPPRIQSALI